MRSVRSLLMIVLATVTVCLTRTIAPAQGNGPGFHVSATGDQNCPGGQTLSQAIAPALVGPLTIPCTSGQGIAAAEAGAGTLRAFGRSEHTCCGTASGGNGSARIQIENVVISGPAAPTIPISLNFRLRGTLAGNTDLGQDSVFLFLGLSGFNTQLSSFSQIDANHNGIFNKTGIFAPLTIGFPSGSIDQTFVTPVVNAAPNQPLRFELQLIAGSAMAGLGSTQSDFFSGNNGFFFPFGTPVFNLPPGYTISIPELNIVNNFVVLPAVVNGDIFIVGTNASEISLAGVNQVTGNITVADNAAAGSIDLNSLLSVGGSLSVSNNIAAGSIDLGSLQSVGGSLSVGNNVAAGSIDLGSLQSVGGPLSIDNNSSLTIIDIDSLQSVGGPLSIDNNSSLTIIDIDSLQSVGGPLSIDNNSSLTTIDIDSLQSVGGPLNIDDNSSLTTVDLSSLETVNGDATVTNNGPCTNVILGMLSTVNGNLILRSCGTGTFTLGPVAPGGNTTLNTNGYTAMNGTTANGATSLSNRTSEAAMTVQLPAGSFSAPVSFSLIRLDPATLTPETGFDANNAPATIDPIAAYQLTFGVPTLNQDASITFDVFLSGLAQARAAALLDALESGSATLATRGAGNQYQAFPICSTGQQPAPGGCVLVQFLDANGQPTSGPPSIVRFSNIVGHFSTWAVAIVTPQTVSTRTFNGLLSPYANPTNTPTFKRGSVVPLKFNWLDASGIIVDSATASPNIAVFPTSCTAQTQTGLVITPEDAGTSGGLRYDTSTQTWVFNWSTKSLSAGCYSIRVTASNSAFAAPAGTFPIALRDR